MINQDPKSNNSKGKVNEFFSQKMKERQFFMIQIVFVQYKIRIYFTHQDIILIYHPQTPISEIQKAFSFIFL